jgi:hypothetical protein
MAAPARLSAQSPPRLITPGRGRLRARPSLQVPETLRFKREPIARIGAQDTALGELLALWRTGLPYLDLADLAMRELKGFLHIVDVTADNPENYRFRLFGSAVSLFHYGNMAGIPVARIPLRQPKHSQEIVRQYFEAAAADEPTFYKVRLVSDTYAPAPDARSQERTYTRLILPMINGAERRLLVLIHPRPIPGLVR